MGGFIRLDSVEEKGKKQMIKMYYHAGSFNHGCEAIVRATHKILGGEQVLYTQDIDSDLKYGLEKIVDVKKENPDYVLSKKERLMAAIAFKMNHTDYQYYKYLRKQFFHDVKKNDIYLSIGGDNYCYQGKDILGYYNRIIHEKGGKTVLWGCSFEPSDMNIHIAKDISLYDMIITRETISYEVLKSINQNTYLFPDPAFQLDVKEFLLPMEFQKDNTVGINVSPLIMKNESHNGITEQNYKKLIEFILDKTNMNIALIPHVVESENDDRQVLEKLYEPYRQSDRVCMIEDCNCMELKGAISQCRFFIGARTHSTIAAYSTCVPTLVVGYSVKAKGIAKDLFGTYDHYVLAVQDLKKETELKESFEWLLENEEKIRTHLRAVMPEYKENARKAGEKIRSLLND